jgi:phospholipid/cholesterol/gamma-HCH transport system substrate-binding protein
MASTKSQNIKLGLFILIGTVLLIVALYFIGSRQNLFGKTFVLKARFENINGLMEGNNVRFSGIDVGTVKEVEIINDSTVEVTMIIEEKIKKFIKKNAIASVGTDGLMGNKLVNIIPMKGDYKSVVNGDELVTAAPLDLADALTTLNATNKNLVSITNNLVDFTNQISEENTIWKLLSDSTVATDVKTAVMNLKNTSTQSLLIAKDLKKISNEIKNGKGMAGTLINDTSFSGQLENTIGKLEKFGDSLNKVSSDISAIVDDLKKGKGSAGKLLNDTTLIHQLTKSLVEIEKGATGFEQNMEALKTSWPFKRYFKKKAKQNKNSQ